MDSTNCKSSATTNGCPARSKNVQQSALDLLKQNLGSDSQLLNEIPIQAVDLSALKSPEMEGYAEEAIKIGTIIDGGAKRTLQAFIASTNRKCSGLPEVKIFGFRTEFNLYKPYSVADVLNKAELLDEFKVLKDYDVQALAVVIKTCFIIKGFELPRNFSFTPRFIKALSKVCRRYRDGAGKMPSSPFSSSDADSSPPTVVVARPVMRKSEQRGPRNQMFGPLRRGSQAPGSPVNPEAPNGVEAPIVESSNDSPSVAVSARAQQIPQTPTPDPRLRARQSMTLALPPVQSMTSITNARPSAPTLLDPETGAFLRDVSEYHKLREESDKLDGDLNNVNDKVAALEQDFGLQLTNLGNYINIGLRNKYYEQKKRMLEELHVKQKTESDFMTLSYEQVKAEKDKRIGTLLQQQEAKVARKEVLEKEMEGKRNGFTVDQLLSFVAAQQRVSKKRKREDRPDEL